MHNATYLQCANIVVTSFIIAATSVYTAWPIFSDSLHACVHVVLQSVFLNRNNAQIYICRRLFNIPRVGMLKSRRHRFALYITADSSVSARMGELFSTNTWLIKHFIYTDSRMRRQVVNLSSVVIIILRGKAAAAQPIGLVYCIGQQSIPLIRPFGQSLKTVLCPAILFPSTI